MKVAFRAKSPCIRTYKEAKALRAHGVHTLLMYEGKTLDQRYPHLNVDDAFDQVVPIKQVYPYHFIEDEGVDIIHNAHPPDYPVRELQGCGVPVVHDIHDLYSLDGPKLPELMRMEADAIKYAQGLVFVSRGMFDYVESTHGEKFFSIIVGNAADSLTAAQASAPWRDADEKHVVYSAAMPRWDEGHFRDMKDTVRVITGQGIHLHVYALIVVPGLREASQRNALLHIHEGITGRHLAQELTMYDAGIINHRSDDPIVQVHLDMSSPNKLYEYWQAGIPAICLPALETNRMIKEYRLGWTVPNFEGLHAVMTQVYRPTDHVTTMEEEVKQLIEFYEDLLEEAKRRSMRK